MPRLCESLYVSAHFDMQQNVYQPITLQLDRLTNIIYDTSFVLPIISDLFSFFFLPNLSFSLLPCAHTHTHSHTLTHTHPLTAVTTDACSSWAPWLELMEGSHKWRQLCTGGGGDAVYAMLWFFPVLMIAPFQRASSILHAAPALNTNNIWRRFATGMLRAPWTSAFSVPSQCVL